MKKIKKQKIGSNKGRFQATFDTKKIAWVFIDFFIQNGPIWNNLSPILKHFDIPSNDNEGLILSMGGPWFETANISRMPPTKTTGI